VERRHGQSIGEAAVRAVLGAGRERAFARLPELLGITRGLPSSTVFARRSQAFAPNPG